VSAPAAFASTLLRVHPREYVRFAADWLTDADRLTEDPGLTGDRLVDAFVGATAEYAAHQAEEPTPAWAVDPRRTLPERWWSPALSGSRPTIGQRQALQRLRAHVLASAPEPFLRHGLVIDADSLSSV
jgi:hypothetical protein